MALIGENGLQSLVTPPSTDNAPAGREIDNRGQGSGRAARADAPGVRGGDGSETAGVVLDLSPAARTLVETGSLAVRASDAAPGANDVPSAPRDIAAAREAAEGPARGPDADDDADDRTVAAEEDPARRSVDVARANDRSASERAAAARAEPAPTGRAGSRFDLTI